MKGLVTILLIAFVLPNSFGQIPDDLDLDSVEYKNELINLNDTEYTQWFVSINNELIKLDSGVYKTIEFDWIQRIEVRKAQSDNADDKKNVYIHLKENKQEEFLRRIKKTE